MSSASMAMLVMMFGVNHAEHESVMSDYWPRYFAIGGGRTWLLVNSADRTLQELVLPEGLEPSDLTTSRDGKHIALTAPYGQGRTSLLIWDGTADSVPKVIGDAAGYHAQPQFSDDGSLIYFAHNPRAGLKPMSHSAGAFAQIYSVKPDGRDLTALTEGYGCHFSPFLAGSQMSYIHTTCIGTDREVGAEGAVVHLKTDLPIDEIEISPDMATPTMVLSIRRRT